MPLSASECPPSASECLRLRPSSDGDDRCHPGQVRLSASDCVPHQMETTVATLGKFASVGRRLAENITANRQSELNDAEKREQLVASVAEVKREI